jgi:hypothetical protein
MYDSSMSSITVPVALSEDLYNEVQTASKRTGLSVADILRQSTRLGMPELVKQMGHSTLRPLTEEDARRCWEEPNNEFDALEHHCASLRVAPATPDDE